MFLSPAIFSQVATMGGGPFSPGDLTSLQGWYDATLLTEADGTDISTWPDSSGNGYDATCASNQPIAATGANGINNVRCILYNSALNNGVFTTPTGLMSGATQGSAFAVFKRNADPPGSQIGGAMFDDFAASQSEASHQPYEDGVIYEHFGTTARKTVGNPTPDLASDGRIYSVHSAASDFRAYLDGVELYSTGTNTVSFSTGAKRLGDSSAVAAFTEWRGRLGEILFFDSVLTTLQRQKVEGYLAHKWGIAANLPGDHPYLSSAP